MNIGVSDKELCVPENCEGDEAIDCEGEDRSGRIRCDGELAQEMTSSERDDANEGTDCLNADETEAIEAETLGSENDETQHASATARELPLEDLRQAVYESRRKRKTARRGLVATLCLAAVAGLVAVTTLFWFPVLQISGASMGATLRDGDVVIVAGEAKPESGSVQAFHYNNSIFVKRVIARGGDWVELEDDGAVKVNGERLDEAYLAETAMGETDLIFPYQVPDGSCFVMGDDREISLDSRMSSIGCIREELMMGEVVFRIWPLDQWGFID